MMQDETSIESIPADSLEQPNTGNETLSDGPSRSNKGTLSIGYGGQLFLFLGGRGGGTVNIDTNFNVSLMAGGGGGYFGAGYAKGFNVMVTNAPSVDELSGFSVQAGGSLAKLAALGGEWVFFSDDEGNKLHGLNIWPIGIGDTEPWPIPVEMHGTVEYDFVVLRFNPYSLISRILEGNQSEGQTNE